MNLLHIINKPEYLFRPGQILHKITFATRLTQDGDLVRVRLPWGDTILVRPREAIGRALLTLGVHELAVSEVLWRLVDSGETCLDIGANLGYMTSLLGAKVGLSGRIHAFEPHPDVFNRLKDNMAKSVSAPVVSVHDNAVGVDDGTADLFEPADFEANQGTSSLVAAGDPGGSCHVEHSVTVRRLDSLFGEDEMFGAMKVDVEGAELEVFRGAERLLMGHRIRDIVWEDHGVFPSESARLLSQHGYRIFQFGKKLFGPSVWDPDAEQEARKLPWETSNYLATLDPRRAEFRLRGRGWHCLRPAKFA